MLLGADHVNATVPLPATPDTFVGADGADVDSVLTGADEADQTPAQPTAFRAATWNTYDVPGVSPVTVTDVGPDSRTRTCNPAPTWPHRPRTAAPHTA